MMNPENENGYRVQNLFNFIINFFTNSEDGTRDYGGEQLERASESSRSDVTKRIQLNCDNPLRTSSLVFETRLKGNDDVKDPTRSKISLPSLAFRYVFIYHWDEFQKLENVCKEITYELNGNEKIVGLLAKDGSVAQFKSTVEKFINFFQNLHADLYQEQIDITPTNHELHQRVISETSQKFAVVTAKEEEKNALIVYGKKSVVVKAIESIRKKLAFQPSDPGNGQQHRNPSKALSFKFSPKTTIFVYEGDITKENADAIVNPANERLQHDGGAAAAIVKIGGREIQEESTTIVQNRGRIGVGQVAVTKGGNLPCKFIIHAVGPAWRDQPKESTRNLLRQACLNSLNAACKKKAKSISIPAISSGLFGVPVQICAEVLFNAVDEFLVTRNASEITLEEIRFVNNDTPTVQVFVKEMTTRYYTSPRQPTQSNGNVGKSIDPLTSGTDDKGRMNATPSKPEHVVSEAFVDVERGSMYYLIAL